MKPYELSTFIYGSSKGGKENRASRTVNGVTETYTVDSGDKLTQVSVSGVATKTFGYDGAGRTTSIQTSSGTTSFTYDFESRVTGITYPNASTNSFTYNGLDTRVGKTDSAGTATFRRMGAGVTAPVLGDGSASFTLGISERRGSTSSFYGADYLGTNSSLYSASETVSATRQYDAFGNLVASSGSSANPFGFAGNWGYQNDSDSGLKLLGHRYYEASTSRFLTRDPIKDGRNWYAYCANDPIGATDPNGLNAAAILPWAAGAAIADGPLPIGDVIAGGLLVVAGLVALAEALTPNGDDAPADYPPIPCPWPDAVVPSTDSPPDGWDQEHGDDSNYTNPDWPGWWIRPDLAHPDPIGPHWDIGPPRQSDLPKIRIAPGPWYVC